MHFVSVPVLEHQIKFSSSLGAGLGQQLLVSVRTHEESRPSCCSQLPAVSTLRTLGRKKSLNTQTELTSIHSQNLPSLAQSPAQRSHNDEDSSQESFFSLALVGIQCRIKGNYSILNISGDCSKCVSTNEVLLTSVRVSQQRLDADVL